MRKPSIGLAPEGAPVIGLLALTTLVFACPVSYTHLTLPTILLV